MGAASEPRRGLGLLSPLREREFALLWTGMAVSLVGDGIYFVAVAWQAYSLSNTPAALSAVGVAWTLPTVVFLILGGAITDRFERRRVLLLSNLAEAVAIGGIGILAVTGLLKLWMLLGLVAVYGAGEAFFNPAFDAIIPTLIGVEEFASASALEHFARPLAVQLLGPALGGVLVATAGPGTAFLADSGTFLVSVWMLMMMRAAPAVAPVAAASLRSAMGDVAAGLRFVLANPWLWATLAAASLSLLAFFGPVQVLLPYLVKNELHSGGGTFGAIRAAGGIGAVVAALAVAQAGLPRRCITWMFAAWAFESLLLVGYGLATGAWIFGLISLAMGGFAALGSVVWGTLMKALVPNHMLGRVSSFDWLVSIGLIPVSFAITGPVAAALGPRTTLICAGALGGAAMIAFLAVPGVREPEARLGTVVSPVQP
ncbi:MAG TPA: MFS transporter [Thermoleophilaceae bacterium]|nr:MFS transporter [Thermoleophilaceae bacterium]